MHSRGCSLKFKRTRPYLQHFLAVSRFLITYVDCEGLKTFRENWELTSKLFPEDPIIPADISIADVENTLVAITDYWESMNLLPFSFPLPG